MYSATDVEGIFRLSGAAKRIKELQAIFDSPDRYGKGLDWTGYTVHDAANILRRYLNQLPEPIVPLDAYEKFRDPLRGHQVQAVGDMEAEAQIQAGGDFDHNQAILTYQRLITELPPLNRQLLLYILDLLAVFSSKSEINRMTSRNLASIFQPGMLSHPKDDMTPQEYRLSQDVVIFLIDNQDSFLIGMSGTAADEKTVKEIQTSAQNRQLSSPSMAKAAQTGLGRSTSNASAGADSLRKFGGIRRNVSVSSKNSKTSMNVPSPVPLSPASPHGSVNTTGGVHRSNTLPSKKSPSIPSSRLNRQSDSPTTPTGLAQGGYLSPSARTSSPSSKLAQAQPSPEGRSSSTASSVTPTAEAPSSLATVNESTVRAQSKELLIPMEKLHLEPPSPGFTPQQGVGTPPRERKVSSFFAKSSTSDNERKDSRPPNKLRKKRLPGSSNPSAQSSANSLHAAPDSPQNQAFYTPMPTPGVNSQVNTDPMASLPPSLSNTDATPVFEAQPHISKDEQASNMPPESQLHHNSDQTLRPSRSPAPSIRSRHSATDQTDQSEADHTDDPATKNGKTEKKHRWRLSSSAKKNGDVPVTSPGPSRVGSNAIAEISTSSVGSFSKPQKSTTVESQQLGTEASTVSTVQTSSTDSTPSKSKEVAKEKDETTEKKGPIGWFKAKVAQAKEERKEREAEKERTKSPPRNGSEHATSKQSLSAMAQDGQPTRGRSMDVRREEKVDEGSEPTGPAHAES